jgi:hypothetical protein
VKQTLETLREDLRESEGVLGKAFERLKMTFLVMDMAAMITLVCNIVCAFYVRQVVQSRPNFLIAERL